MSRTALAGAPGLEELARLQAACVAQLERLPPAEVNRQFHTDLSPLGWHVGHCVFVECYWLRQRVLGDDGACAPVRDIYLPELCTKPSRASRLPRPGALREWALPLQAQNRERLADPPRRARRHPLLRDGYLTAFLAQHYAQHLETMGYVLTARARAGSAPPAAGGRAALTPRRCAAPERVPLGGLAGRVGTTASFAYDNERPPRRVRLRGGHIARRPVSARQYLAFMADGGYREPRHWDPEGWRWRRQHRVEAPDGWLQAEDGHWRGVTSAGVAPIDPDAAVSGLSRHEAVAYARWAGARLPQEYEWERARRAGLLEGVGQVWEWCGNPFHAYPGFRAFPYDGYSRPWFDGRHFTLRGGCPLTEPVLRRPSFRNFFEADKRHLPAGLRLAWD